MKVYIKKVNREFEIPAADELPENSREYIYNYGWKQRLADSIADGEKFDTAAKQVARIEAVIESIAAGEVRAARAGLGAIGREVALLGEGYARKMGWKTKDYDALAKQMGRISAAVVAYIRAEFGLPLKDAVEKAAIESNYEKVLDVLTKRAAEIVAARGVKPETVTLD